MTKNFNLLGRNFKKLYQSNFRVKHYSKVSFPHPHKNQYKFHIIHKYCFLVCGTFKTWLILTHWQNNGSWLLKLIPLYLVLKKYYQKEVPDCFHTNWGLLYWPPVDPRKYYRLLTKFDWMIGLSLTRQWPLSSFLHVEVVSDQVRVQTLLRVRVQTRVVRV